MMHYLELPKNNMNPMHEKLICLLGARGLVGTHLIPLLRERGFAIHAHTRRNPSKAEQFPNVIWHAITPEDPLAKSPICISMMPLWELPFYFRNLKDADIKRLIAFSSTHVIAPIESLDYSQRQMAVRLAAAEEKVAAWADKNKIQWTILRPTMVYDEGKDRSITPIANFIKRFGFYPIIGKGSGLRMPVFAGDLADAIIKLLETDHEWANYYVLSGGEALTYKGIVTKIFRALDEEPFIIHIPWWLVTGTLWMTQIFPRFRHLPPSLALRTQVDQTFPHEDAKNDFAYNPRAFRPVFR